MPTPARDRWRDIEGTHISLFCWVEQVAECPEPGMLPSRLRQRGQVVGRGLDSIYVRYHDDQLVSLPPQLLRLLPGALGEILVPQHGSPSGRTNPATCDPPDPQEQA